MSMNDYYTVLGVSRDADTEEIRRAYREKAMLHHPDRNQGDANAEVKFKEAAEAYDILSDPEKREQYDNIGLGGNTFNFGDIFGIPRWQNGKTPRKGTDVTISVTVELKDILADLQKTVQIPTDEHCQHCSGSGLKPGVSKSVCKDCKGSGVVTNIFMHGNVRLNTQQPCIRCHGQGNFISTEDKCQHCDHGKVLSTRETIVSIPSGISPEFLLRMPGLGKLGMNGGPRGDAMLRINIQPNDKFKRVPNNHNDVILDLPISFVQSCLGDTINVEMLDGSTKEIVIPANSQNGHTILLDGQGVPSLIRKDRGTLWVRFNIQVPTSINVEQSDLLRKFEEIERGKNVFEKNTVQG